MWRGVDKDKKGERWIMTLTCFCAYVGRGNGRIVWRARSRNDGLGL